MKIKNTLIILICTCYFPIKVYSAAAKTLKSGAKILKTGAERTWTDILKETAKKNKIEDVIKQRGATKKIPTDPFLENVIKHSIFDWQQTHQITLLENNKKITNPDELVRYLSKQLVRDISGTFDLKTKIKKEEDEEDKENDAIEAKIKEMKNEKTAHDTKKLMKEIDI